MLKSRPKPISNNFFFVSFKKAAMARVSIMMMLVGFAMLLDSVVAVDHTVGAPNGGWDLSTNLQSWATSQTFSVGDNIVFQYSSTHDVLEVSKADYDSCVAGSPISTNANSPTKIPLTAAGSRYFICGVGSHCSQGMKVQINTVASAPAPPQTTTPSAPSTPTNGPTSDSPPPPLTGVIVDPPSSAITLNMTVASILGFGFLVMMLLSL